MEEMFIVRLDEAAGELNDEVEAMYLVLDVLQDSLRGRAESVVTRSRQLLQSVFRVWGVKYAITLGELEIRRSSAARQLGNHLKELGYE